MARIYLSNTLQAKTKILADLTTECDCYRAVQDVKSTLLWILNSFLADSQAQRIDNVPKNYLRPWLPEYSFLKKAHLKQQIFLIMKPFSTYFSSEAIETISRDWQWNSTY